MTAQPAQTLPRPCERYCPRCEQWKHHSRFRSFKRRKDGVTSFDVTFRPLCKDCEQIERNERKNADRPLALMQQRVASHARALGVERSFLWTNMNWAALVPYLRAMMGDDGRCLSCGHSFLSERDVQIEHREPPRELPDGSVDWARQHARNLALFCHSCNNTKGSKPYAVWLDEQEAARLSNERHRQAPELVPLLAPVQLTLDDALAPAR